jgi:hypothetical protein
MGDTPVGRALPLTRRRFLPLLFCLLLAVDEH